MTAIVTRFAPSPTGLLHLGNARTALFAWLYARGRDGRCLLRIEDTDRERSSDGWLDAQREDLDWLGFDFDPPTWRQSERRGIHAALLERLRDSDRAYPCFCTPEALAAQRAVQAAAGRPPRYDGTCAGLSPEAVSRRVAAGEPHVLRFRMPPRAAVTFDDVVHGMQRTAVDEIGDFVIRRSDGTPAFLFANAVDDAESGVTLVLRGEDHLSNTPRQLLLLEALGMQPPAYGHLPLLLAGDGVPMSKREESGGALAARAAPFSVRHFRDRGYHPLALVNYIARLGCSWPHNDCVPLPALASGFDATRLGKAPAKFDAAQLDHWQRVALDGLDDDAWWAWAGGEAAGLVPAPRRADFAAAVRPNVLFPGDALAWAMTFYGDAPAYGREAMETIAATPASFFDAAAGALEEHGDDHAALVEALSSATGLRGKRLYAPLRAALTGRLDGPALTDILALTDEARARDRLAQARGEGHA